MDNSKINIIVPVAISLVACLVLWVVTESLPIVVVFIPGVLISLVFYFKYCFKNNAPVNKLLPLYLVALALQMLHFTEEFLARFPSEVPKILGQEPYPEDIWIVFNAVAYAIFILGAIALLKKIKALLVIPLFFIIVGVILNGIAHVLGAVYVGGYVPGLYTAVIMLIVAFLFIKKLKLVFLTSNPTQATP